MLSMMSGRCKLVFERGKFFIESGTIRGFQSFYDNGSGIIKYIPRTIIKRIIQLINNNDKDEAMLLWMLTCISADRTPRVIIHKIVYFIFRIIFNIILVYMFVQFFVNKK